jgi:hypothetical protein
VSDDGLTGTAAVEALSDHVNVEPSPGYALFWDGKQRTTTCERVPRDLALKWMRAKWASYCWSE